MKVQKFKVRELPLVYLLLVLYATTLSNGNENEETAEFHTDKSKERRHLLAHLADRMDLDGEGLRHIRKHMGEVIGDTGENQDIQDVADGDNVKGIFYFFKLHDYDNNQKLDGLEWMRALTDFHQEDSGKEDFQAGGALFLEHEVEAIIDELLKKHDANDDGMIDFVELMNSKVESLMTDLDKPAPDLGEQQEQQNEPSLEQEYNNQQQDKDQEQHSEQNQDSPSLAEEYNQHQQQQANDQQQDQQNLEQPTGDEQSLEPESNQQQPEPQNVEQPGGDEHSLEQEFNEEHQILEEPAEGDQSLEQEFNQQQQHQEQSEQQQNLDNLEKPQEQEQTEHSKDNEENLENKQPEADQNPEQESNQEQHEPSLEEEYNQQHQQQ